MHYQFGPSSSFTAFCSVLVVLGGCVSNSMAAAQDAAVPITLARNQHHCEDEPINIIVGGTPLRDLVARVNDKLQIMLDKMNNADHNVEMLKLKLETLSVKENYLDQKLSNFETRVGERLDNMEAVMNRTVGGRLDSMQAETQQKFEALEERIVAIV